MKTNLINAFRVLSLASAAIVAAFGPSASLRAAPTPITDIRMLGTNGTVGNSTQAATLTVTTLGSLILNNGTISLSAGTITGSAGIIPSSLISGLSGGTVTQITSANANIGVTLTTTTPVLTLTTAIPVGNLNNGTGASASTFWRGDGTWANPAGSGTVTQVTSANGNIAISNTTSTPQLTLTTSIPVGNLAGGSGASGTTFWRGDGTWATPASSGGTVTQVTGTTGRVSVSLSTSTPVVTLPTTLTLSDTTLYLGSLSGTTLLGGLTVTLSGNPAFNNAATGSTNFGGYFQIGTNSVSNGYGYPGSVQQGYLVGSGMNLFPGGFAGPQDTISAWWTRLWVVLSSTNSQLPILHFGDSLTTQIWANVMPQMKASIGDAGVGGYDVSVSLSGTAATVTNSFTTNPAGTIETMTATNDSLIYYVNGGGFGYADTLKIYYAQVADGGTFKVQTASASIPNGVLGAFSDEAGYTAVSTSGSPTTGVITLTKSPGYVWQIKLVQTVSASGGTTINFRPAFWSSSISGVQTYALGVGGISLSDSNTVSTAYLAPFLGSFRGGAPALITWQMAEGNTYVGPALETMKTLWNTNVASTSWTIMGLPPYGTSGVPNSNPTVSTELNNGYLRSFALRNADAGFSYYDIYGFLRSAPWLYSIGAGDDIHSSNLAQSFLGAKLVRDMGITALNVGIYPSGSALSNIGGATPQSVFGPTVTATGTVAFTHNTLGAARPSYYGFRIRSDHDQNYAQDNAVFDVRNNLYVGNGTSTLLTLSTSASTTSVAMRLGSSGSSIDFYGPASAGRTQYIALDQFGGGLNLAGGYPTIGFFSGNSDTYGAVITRTNLGSMNIHSGSLSGQLATINLITSGTTALTVSDSGANVINMVVRTSGVTIPTNLIIGVVGSTGTTSLTRTFSLGSEYFNAATATQSSQVKFRLYDDTSNKHGFVPTTTGVQLYLGSSSDFFITGQNNGTEIARFFANGGFRTNSGSFTTTLSVTGTASMASVSATTTSVSSLRVGAAGTAMTVVGFSTATLASGTVTVTKSGITTSTRIFPSRRDVNGSLALGVFSYVANTGSYSVTANGVTTGTILVGDNSVLEIMEVTP